MDVITAGKIPLMVMDGLCWAFNSVEGLYQLHTIYVPNTPFVKPLKIDCVGAMDTIPPGVFK